MFKLKHGFHLFGWCKTEKQKLAKYKLMQTSSSCMSVTGMNHISTPHHTQRFAPLLIITSPSLVNRRKKFHGSVPFLSLVLLSGTISLSLNNTVEILFSSVQFKMVSMRLEKPICAPPRLLEVSPTLPLERLQCSSDWRWPSLVLSRNIV